MAFQFRLPTPLLPSRIDRSFPSDSFGSQMPQSPLGKVPRVGTGPVPPPPRQPIPMLQQVIQQILGELRANSQIRQPSIGANLGGEMRLKELFDEREEGQNRIDLRNRILSDRLISHENKLAFLTKLLSDNPFVQPVVPRGRVGTR